MYVSSVTSEKEAEKIKERLAQEEAEAMEMEDEENKIENTNNDKEVRKEFNQRDLVEQQRNIQHFFCLKFWKSGILVAILSIVGACCSKITYIYNICRNARNTIDFKVCLIIYDERKHLCKQVNKK